MGKLHALFVLPFLEPFKDTLTSTAPPRPYYSLQNLWEKNLSTIDSLSFWFVQEVCSQASHNHSDIEGKQLYTIIINFELETIIFL